MFSKAGYSVCLYDTDVKQLEAALESIKTTLDEFENKELLCGPIKTANDAFKLISTTESLSEVVKDSIFLQVSTYVRFFSFCVVCYRYCFTYIVNFCNVLFLVYGFVYYYASVVKRTRFYFFWRNHFNCIKGKLNLFRIINVLRKLKNAILLT